MKSKVIDCYWLLFSTNATMFQLYHGENRFIFYYSHRCNASLGHWWPLRFELLDLFLPKSLRLFGYHKYLALSVPDECCSRNVSWALNVIFTFLFFPKYLSYILYQFRSLSSSSTLCSATPERVYWATI